MIAVLLHRVALTVLLGLLGMTLLHRAEPAPQPLLVKADYQLCATVKPGTIEPRADGTDPRPRKKDIA